jgi:hypothetical protein
MASFAPRGWRDERRILCKMRRASRPVHSGFWTALRVPRPLRRAFCIASSAPRPVPRALRIAFPASRPLHPVQPSKPTETDSKPLIRLR